MKRNQSRLRILPEESPLRGGGPFLESISLADAPSDRQPRALRGLARIVDNGLCHRCGSCVGICPTGVLGLDAESYPSVQNLSACTDCDLCVRVCPGDEFDYLAIHNEVLQQPGRLESTHGHFRRAALAHSKDPSVREGSTSGGFVTGLLDALIKSNKIDGALVIGSDDKVLWRGRPKLASVRESVREAMKSKYAISPTNALFSAILSTPGRYALVGLPCQIHGYHKARKLDARLDERVVLTVGLFCHAAIEHEAFEIIWDSLGKDAEHATRFVSRIGKHPGAPHIELEDGSLQPVYFPNKKGFRPTSMEMINILYRLYTPARCLTCFDALADLADISVGDPWMAPPAPEIDFSDGWSFVLIRTVRGEKLFQSVEESGEMTVYPVTEREALHCNAHMAEEKRWRAFRVIETHKRQGRSIPSYGEPLSELPRHHGTQFFKTEMNLLTHVLCFLPRVRPYVLRFFLSNGGYGLLWLNNKRRRVKVWARDNFERIRRNLVGRE